MPLLQKQNYNWFQNCFCTQIREDWGQNMSFLYVWIFQPVTVFKVFSLTVKVSFLFKGNPDRSTKKKMNISLLTNAFPHNASAWPSHLKNTEANVILMLTIKKLSGFFFFFLRGVDRHLLVLHKLVSSLNEKCRKAQRCKATAHLGRLGCFYSAGTERRAKGSSTRWGQEGKWSSYWEGLHIHFLSCSGVLSKIFK